MRPSSHTINGLLALAALAACGSESPQPSGGVSTGLTLPDPPVLTPCPEGWREVEPISPDDVVTCDPWPEGGPSSCPEGQAHFPGEPGCAPIGDPCPAGDWPDKLPEEGTVLYVQADAGSEGSGTRDAPFGTIAEALALADAGTVVALAAGEYGETVTLPQGIELWGTCAAETRLAPSVEWTPPDPNASWGDFEFPAAVTMTGMGASVHNLEIGGDVPGVLVQEGASGTLDGVWVHEAFFTGIFVRRGNLTARSLVVEDTAGRGEGTLDGFGIGMSEGSITAERSLLVRNRGMALVVAGGGTADLTRVAVRDTRRVVIPFVDGTALFLTQGADVRLVESALEGNPGWSIVMLDQATLRLEDVVVRGPDPAVPVDQPGGVMWKDGDGTLDIERALFDHVLGPAVLVRQDTVHATLRDVVMRYGQPYPSPGPGIPPGMGAGVVAWSGAQVELERVLILQAAGLGIWADRESAVTGTDVAVIGTREMACDLPCQNLRCELPDAEPTCEPYCPCDALSDGIGVAVTRTAIVELTRFLISDGALAGLQLAEIVAVDLHEGTVSNNPIAVNLQVRDFDVSRLQDGVVYLNNETNLSTQTLPVPDPSQYPGF